MKNISAKHPIAYFCAEYGLRADLPLYAGGLGILAGDTIKEAADQNLPLVALGLMYRGESAVQTIDENGRQHEGNMQFDPLTAGFEHVYLDEMPLFIKVHLTQIDVWARCWKMQLKDSVTLYLLDTETDQNLLNERNISHALYCGTEESLLKQQLVLGIGGCKLLQALGIRPTLYHINEGRPAFLHWQLIRNYMDSHGMSYETARKLAIEKTVYTNHTLVSAGNESYNIHSLRSYGQYYAKKMGISIDSLLEPGMENTADHFVMTRFALNVSHKANGVSQLHTQLSKKNWPEYNWCNVTNGVHMPTWQQAEMMQCDLDGNCIWNQHTVLKRKTMEYVQQQTGYGYDPDRFIMAWARRIASYKQLDKLFADVDRFKTILADSNKPGYLLIAGKAHAHDTGGKMILQEAIHYMQKQLAGHVLFVPNYNIDIAKHLVSGVDLWLNTPVFGKEACGTSGMKAIANGVLQCTVNDGWAHEVEWHEIGWLLDPEHVSQSFYHILSTEIIPLFYNRSSTGIPESWVDRMKKSIQLAQRFSTKRMLEEYVSKLYV